jgi:predicted fused transcriptional regulator/phosphomethylpyrimidine kinase
MARIHREAEKYFIIESLKEAIKKIEENKNIAKLVPEVQMNLVMAISNAKCLQDVAGIAGRIVKIVDKLKATSFPEFGVSSHVANTVLVAMKYDPSMRAGMNIKYSDKILRISNNIGLAISSYDREKEPIELKKTEGKTTSWGALQAIKKFGKVPDIIWHLGEWGKEPMISILGKSPIEVVDKAIRIAKYLH